MENFKHSYGSAGQRLVDVRREVPSQIARTMNSKSVPPISLSRFYKQTQCSIQDFATKKRTDEVRFSGINMPGGSVARGGGGRCFLLFQ